MNDISKDIDALPSLKELLMQHDLWAKKSLGQNFLLNLSVTDVIASKAKIEEKTVLEIGPGPGGLTRSLLRAGATKVIALEKDQRCIQLLSSLVDVSKNRLILIEGDALNIDFCSLLKEQKCEKISIVANLPYNIGTLLLLGWLHNLDVIESMTLMFQKEVALRIIAQKQTKDYGRLSILCQFLCNCQKVMELSPQAFTPPPKISSAVVRLTPKLLTDNEKGLLPVLEKITAAAFNQRRKMIKSSLKEFFSEEELVQLIGQPTKRAEELSIEQFVTLAQHYSQKH